MNRLSDIKATLRKNLDDNSAHRDRIEFIVVCFDAEDTTFRWVSDNFSDEIATGYLRVYQSNELRQWHFGKAKNAFRNLMRGRIYASLDGDNFTGKNGGRHIIDVFEHNNYDCVFHQFQGDWGDGTCGRVSLTRDDYITFGYDNDFLPRQWDELDAILSVLVHRRTRNYVCYRGKSIAQKSHPFKRFLTENNINLVTVEMDPALDPLAQENTGVSVGQHDNSYVQDDARLKYSSVFNHLSSFYKNTSDHALRTRYAGELVETQRLMSDHIDSNTLLNWFLDPIRPDLPLVAANDIVLVSCIKNEAALAAWQDYYRKLGVTKFFLVDDFSDEPISALPGEDTWVWRPKTGKFRYSKAFWLQTLLKKFCIGEWAVCVDSDEYIDLPKHYAKAEQASPLASLVAYASAEKISYFAGFLLDLAPARSAYEALKKGEMLEREQFNRYQFRPARSHSLFLKHNTVKWSYGNECAEWAYRVDIRFRLNRAFDSLRKFPILLVRETIHLNQGFHDLILDGQKRTWQDMRRTDLLPIRHFKLFNTQHDAKAPVSRPADAYHSETKLNIERLRANIHASLKQACISPFTFEYIDFGLIPVPATGSVKLRVCKLETGRLRDFREQITRSAHIPVVIRDCEPIFDAGVIFAKSITVAAQWICITTPFSNLVYSSENSAELKLGEDRRAEFSESRDSDVVTDKQSHNLSFGAVVGLGRNCQVKRAILQKIWFDHKGTIAGFDVNSDFVKNGNFGTYLFDWTWTRTPVKTLITIFENDFQNVFERKDLKIVPLANGRSEVMNKLNGLSFPHHFTSDENGQISHAALDSSFANVASKIEYLAGKTRKTITSTKVPILFVLYAEATPHDMDALVNAIRRKSPNLKFSVILVRNLTTIEHTLLPEEVVRVAVIPDEEYPGNISAWLKVFDGISFNRSTPHP
jgi:hypothetical protein